MERTKFFIKKAIKHKGRLRAFIRRHYGNEAFTKHGYKEVIKKEYLDKAEAYAKKIGDTHLEKQVVLAKTLESFHE